jgi:hypothetical protein
MEERGAQEKKSEKPAFPGLSGNKKPQLKPVGVGVLVGRRRTNHALHASKIKSR